MHLDSKLNGNRIFLQKLSKTFKQAEEFFYLVKKNKEHLFPFAYWDLNLNSPEDCYERIVSQHDKWETGTAYIYGIFENNTNKLIGNIFAGHFSRRSICKARIGCCRCPCWLTNQHITIKKPPVKKLLWWLDM